MARKWHKSWHNMSPQLKAAWIGGICVIVAAIVTGIFMVVSSCQTPVSTPIPTTPSLTPIPTLIPPRIGKQPESSESFSVDANYDPSGKMGDIGDVNIEKDVGVVRFTYETMGRGPHKWDWTYVDGELNPEPAQFAGVMYLDPPNNWGWHANGGFDLRENRGVVKWEARSLREEVRVEFVIGGVDWVWDEVGKKRVQAPYPDSMPRVSLGIRTLTEDWQSFEYELMNRPEDNFCCVVGGFGWVINWNSNGVQLNEARTGPELSKTFAIEIRNVSYER